VTDNLPAPKNVFEIVQHQEQSFNNVNNGDIVKWQKESQFAIQLLQKNKYLSDQAWSNAASLQNAIINVASIGISLNPATKHAYLVPRDSMVCLDISYMGLLHLAVTRGSIEWGQAKTVYSNDVYTNNGIDKAPTHKQNSFGDKGDIIGVYCTVKIPSGDYLTEEMDIKALNKVKATSKAANGPWKTWPDEMMRKTVVKRASKYWPSCESLSEAIHVLNQHEGLEEAEQYTEESKNTLDDLMSSDNSFSFEAFARDVMDSSEGEYNALYNSFPNGKITANKKKFDALQREGFELWQSFAQEVKGYIENEDVPSLQAELMDFEAYEKRHLVRVLGATYATTLQRLLKPIEG